MQRRRSRFQRFTRGCSSLPTITTLFERRSDREPARLLHSRLVASAQQSLSPQGCSGIARSTATPSPIKSDIKTLAYLVVSSGRLVFVVNSTRNAGTGGAGRDALVCIRLALSTRKSILTSLQWMQRTSFALDGIRSNSYSTCVGTMNAIKASYCNISLHIILLRTRLGHKT